MELANNAVSINITSINIQAGFVCVPRVVKNSYNFNRAPECRGKEQCDHRFSFHFLRYLIIIVISMVKIK